MQILARALETCDFEDDCLEERRDGGTGQEERKVLIDRQMEGRHTPAAKHKLSGDQVKKIYSTARR